MDPHSLTPTEISNEMQGAGFDGEFMPIEGGQIRCLTCRSTFAAKGVATEGIGRTEGESDPDDETAVVAISCPECKASGTLTLKYGPTASAEDADVLLALRS